MISKANILHIETSTTVCSVAISSGDEVIALREINEDKSHGSRLNPFIREALDDAGLSPSDMDAVAVSKGPGSYTGLRIGVSTVKGFAYSLDIPVIGITTLLPLTYGATLIPEVKEIITSNPDTLLCPMLDARRMEVFTAMYRPDFSEQSPISAVIIDETSFFTLLKDHPIVFFGNGSGKASQVLKHPNARFIDNVLPSARYMVPFILELFRKKQFEDTAYFEPFYLKDFIATIPKKMI